MAQNSVEERASDFVRRLNVNTHPKQLEMIIKIFNRGQTLEGQTKILNEQNLSNQNEKLRLEGITLELRREIVGLRQQDDALQRKFGGGGI